MMIAADFDPASLYRDCARSAALRCTYFGSQVDHLLSREDADHELVSINLQALAKSVVQLIENMQHLEAVQNGTRR